MNFSTEGMAWLENLAQEVDLLSGYYQTPEAAAIYCENCEVVQAYCRGCGERLLDVYDEDSNSCENCGISLAYCNICGAAVIELEDAPDNAQPPEYWKYCPACGEAVFGSVNYCPHCKTQMSDFLDEVYEETFVRVSRAIHAVERREDYIQYKYDEQVLQKYEEMQGCFIFWGFILCVFVIGMVIVAIIDALNGVA